MNFSGLGQSPPEGKRFLREGWKNPRLAEGYMNNAGGGLVGAGFQLAKRFLRFSSLKRFGLKVKVPLGR